MPKVLVVDDEKEITAALRRLLKRSGFEVATACSGEEALSALESFNPDLVLSDFRMPGMNGAALLSEVKRRKPMVLRLIISGYADLDSVLASVNDGEICRFISKPWDDAALPTLLHGLLADRNARATLFQPFANPKQGVSAALYDQPTLHSPRTGTGRDSLHPGRQGAEGEPENAVQLPEQGHNSRGTSGVRVAPHRRWHRALHAAPDRAWRPILSGSGEVPPFVQTITLIICYRTYLPEDRRLVSGKPLAIGA